jgi:MFS superfamily sulfate permease-like transporter
VCRLLLTGLLENLPKVVLAAVVLPAIAGLFDLPALIHMWRVSRPDFYAAAIALGAVLLLGILQGILLAALASVLILLVRASRPHVAFLGRIPGTNSYSDFARHPENEVLPGVIAARPEASLMYVNADSVLTSILHRVRAASSADIRTAICELSASPYLDLAGSHMLHELHSELRAASRRALLEPMGGCAICCEPMAWAIKSGGSTGPTHSMASSRSCQTTPPGSALPQSSEYLDVHRWHIRAWKWEHFERARNRKAVPRYAMHKRYGGQEKLYRGNHRRVD